MLTAFRALLLVCMVIAFCGSIAGTKYDQRNCRLFYGMSGVLFIASLLTQ